MAGASRNLEYALLASSRCMSASLFGISMTRKRRSSDAAPPADRGKARREEPVSEVARKTFSTKKISKRAPVPEPAPTKERLPNQNIPQQRRSCRPPQRAASTTDATPVSAYGLQLVTPERYKRYPECGENTVP